MNFHQKLIALVDAHKGNGLRFGQGIWTADKYVESLAQCVGMGMCQNQLCGKDTAFSAVIKHAAGILSFAGDDLQVEPDQRFRVKLATSTASIKRLLGDVDLPKHSMMAFAHTLTTPREDRDGDVLETAGAQVDPKMPLLWQHVHTLPIGRALKTIEKSAERLRMASVLLDMNDLTHDAGILVEADALRFSHGFRAIEFSERNKEVAGAPGFRVKSFEIMEESLVSVPSNIDAELEKFSRGELKSQVFKSHAKWFFDARKKVHGGVKMNFDSFGDLKAAADAGQITVAGKPLEVLEPTAQKADYGNCPKCGAPGVSRKDGMDTCDKGHTYPSDQAKGHECSCHKTGNKADGKASLDRESFSTREEAEARATVLGCTGSHFSEGKWHPCQDEWEAMLYAPPTVDPALGKPTGRADAGTVLDKSWVDSGALKGSYGYRMNKLNETAARHLMASGIDIGRDDYASVWAMFDKYAIVALQKGSGMAEPYNPGDDRYFKCEWTETKREPSWTGAVSEVAVSSDVSISELGKAVAGKLVKSLNQILGTRAGRTLSQANVDRLEQIKQDLAELAGMDLPRAAQALAERGQRLIENLISSAVPVLDEDPQPKSMNDRDAVGVLMQSQNTNLLKQTVKALEKVLMVHKANEDVADYKRLLRR